MAKLTPAQRAEIERQKAALARRLAAPRPEPREEPIRLGQSQPTAKVVKAKPLGQGLRQAVRRLAKRQIKTPARRVAAGRIILRPIRLDGRDTPQE